MVKYDWYLRIYDQFLAITTRISSSTPAHGGAMVAIIVLESDLQLPVQLVTATI